MSKLTRILVVLAVSIGVPLAGQFASAQPPNKKNQKPSAAATAATQAAKDAKDADAKADSSKKSIAEANEAIKAAQKDVDDANKALKKTEDDTIDAQSADSEVGKARDAYRAATTKYQEARKSVLDDQSFKDRIAAAKESEDSGAALLALRKEFDEMPVIAEARTAMQSAKETYDPLKTKLLQGTQDWVTANDDLKAKKKALDDAKHKYAEAVAAAKKAKADAQKAEAEARAAAMQAAAQTPQNPPPRRRRPY
jgi:colicin import membrane protein